MFYTYILESIKDNRKYVGSTNDLKRRLAEHNKGVGGAYTKKNAPFTLIYYEAYLSRSNAMRAERFYKTGYGREVLKSKLADSPRKG